MGFQRKVFTAWRIFLMPYSPYADNIGQLAALAIGFVDRDKTPNPGYDSPALFDVEICQKGPVR